MDGWEDQRLELHAACEEMYRRGLVGAYSGNASLRLEGDLEEGLLLVTPTQRPYYRLRPEDLVVVDLSGEACVRRSRAFLRDRIASGDLPHQGRC